MLSGLMVVPEWDTMEVGWSLLQATMDAIRRQGVRRIESPGISMASPWLVPVCERAGFQTSWRAFLRVRPPPPNASANATPTVRPAGAMAGSTAA